MLIMHIIIILAVLSMHSGRQVHDLQTEELACKFWAEKKIADTCTEHKIKCQVKCQAKIRLDQSYSLHVH